MSDFNPLALMRQDLLGFPPYVPSLVAMSDMERVIKLDANENPYGPSPRVLRALAETRTWNRYATQDELRPALGGYVGVDASHIVIGNGADEVIDLVERIFLAPGDIILNCPPTFEMYSQYAKIIGATTVDVPRRNDFAIDIDAIERAVEIYHPKLLFVANPNNPDGSLTSAGLIERLLKLPVLVVLDEAYAEFAGSSLIERVPEQPNLVVLRTFSKWAGLAGLRIGYAVAPRAVADHILRTKSPYNVNAAAIVAARVSLEDKDYLYGNVQKIIAERKRLSAEVGKIPFLKPFPSCTNFILCLVDGYSPRDLRNQLAEQNILIRAFGSPLLGDFVRITVGSPDQDNTLLAALRQIGNA